MIEGGIRVISSTGRIYLSAHGVCIWWIATSMDLSQRSRVSVSCAVYDLFSSSTKKEIKEATCVSCIFLSPPTYLVICCLYRIELE